MYQIDMDKLAAFLPLHLLGVLMSSDRDEALFEYMLRGIRLLHSLCDLAPRHAKVEQVTFSNACYLFLFYFSFLFFVFCACLMCSVMHNTYCMAMSSINLIQRLETTYAV